MRTIVLLAVVALGGVSVIMGDTNHRHHYGVSFEDGTCKYRNKTLKDGGSERFKYPCEHWRCDVKAKTLTVQGCSVNTPDGSCVHVHNPRFIWPHCCPRNPIC
ncbi:uncharacterized protein LOC115326444 [Ixodes scapularis]|uniref:uncharacterized protein LOC115326444 n=1 Tax=Ixodes scapularis TaxID=6945 RepID=UPI001A9EDF89|nr:uncharacterized protein LOC115326444 [Ixodes scapularis]